MTIPILIEGRERGTLQIRPEGAYTRFEARCALLPGLQRLYVFGGGRSACLGVLVPEDGALTLRQKLSRAAMKDFPAPIESAAAHLKSIQEEEEYNAAALLKTASHLKSIQEDKEHNAAALLKTAALLKWEEREDGSLVGTADGVRLVALPCALRRVPPGVDLREIGGRTYLVFRS